METGAVSGYSGANSMVKWSATLIHRWVRRHIQIRRKSSRILVLTTIGYDSGEPQTDAVGYFEEGPALFVVASNYGSDRHSTWYLNLRVHPQVYVQIEEVQREMVAVTATPLERERLWARLAADDRRYGYYQYQRSTARQIPIVLLHSVSSRLA